MDPAAPLNVREDGLSITWVVPDTVSVTFTVCGELVAPAAAIWIVPE